MFQEILPRLLDRRDLTVAEAEAVFTEVMDGALTPVQIGALLVALRTKGETVAEITGAARAMRGHATRVELGDCVAVDTCGTGGDGAHTFNISTTAAFVVAGAGLPVAKHGNKGVSSKCGSADLLTALGVRLDLTPERMAACVREVGLGFLFAPLLHQAMRYAGPVRAELKTRTIFNLLGPLTNPAGVPFQVVGVFAGRWVEPVGRVLAELGCRHAFVVHGDDGLDEATVTGKTYYAEVKGGTVHPGVITPEAVGLASHPASTLVGGDPAANAAITRQVLAGAVGAQRDVVLLNAALALVAGGRAATITAGIAQAAAAIDSGAAATVLERLVAFTQGG
ncbi:MAG: anthranilate phosphoribosyltransferase [Nitrospirae bacterium CG18_big_fil_WC_8_21_14_2_50_70_55]|nr:anthranilate phosphoribosyltransferase [Deltaproteobacteria bacterium]OIP64372.1 MAG: anthranilate phosphoribosyltransferase [Nitrospirae bacterium CG2_30_70_394]PIQ06716.1 MAG: anthranilate phosphoribosyltransferase [Nitrospirae bacterium CG18_big_fil_WC_8_21_14_2_50_70_55]PIU80072.1 MAG: anthranilate phosphoribosyltransferase [Nitrospirae bacterium CG06_land_8_20_14_3_00_70_43]PIW83189.1 MAG: anthranilate phosphoribosyltransferase [Nitrospirae bacterium CG_4_8_14_3_um_filter_70_85]PIX8277